MNTKAKGSRNELRSKRFLELQGYRCCKAGASLGAWDVIGVSKSDVILLQVKSGRWPRSVEMQSMREFEIPPLHVRKCVHRWMPRARQPEEKWL